jgi:fructokinase
MAWGAIDAKCKNPIYRLVTKGGRLLILVIGEMLIDIFPDYRRMGGAPFNFAFHLKKLGLPVRLISRVGDDRHGHALLCMAEKNGFDTADIQIDDRHPTGTVQVTLDEAGVPQFNICRNVAYDYLLLGPDTLAGIDDAAMIYFGSLLQRTDGGHQQVTEFLTRHGDRGARFCDINMRPPHVNPQAVAESLKHADLLKLNEDELADIRNRFSGPTDSDATLTWLMTTFDVQSVALTRGGQGSTVAWSGGIIHSPAAEVGTIVDTVGAGDGYAAILAAGHIRGLPWDTIIQAAARFAERICQIPGALPEDDTFYNDFRNII